MLRFKKTFKKNLKKGKRNEQQSKQLSMIREEPENEFDSLSEISENEFVKEVVDPDVVRNILLQRQKQIVDEFIDEGKTTKLQSACGHT